MVAPDASLGWRFGLCAAGGYLAWALFIAFLAWKGGSGEYWLLFVPLDLPLWPLYLLSPVSVRDWFNHSLAFKFTVGAACWYAIGWLVGRIVMFCRDHS